MVLTGTHIHGPKTHDDQANCLAVSGGARDRRRSGDLRPSAVCSHRGRREVLTERGRLPGKEIALPVMGTFDVVDGKIPAWRDYFDMYQFMSQLSA